MLEFTLSLLVLTPLLIGTYVFGFRLVRKQQTDQITRDLAHMYSRGVNFKLSGAATEAMTKIDWPGATTPGSARTEVSMNEDCNPAPFRMGMNP